MRLVECTTASFFEKFLHRQQALKRSSAPHEISYGFLLTDGDPEEEEFLCRTGLPVGYSFFGDLGRSDQGVYLSKHPDTVSPAPFFDGVPHRILIFKMLRGRSKPVNFESFRDAPDPTFHSHVARHYYDSTGGGISQASPHTRFRHSQIFLFEYEGEGRYAKVLSSVYPIAIVTAIFNPPSPQTLVLLSPDETQALVWTGGLTFGGTNNVEKVELLSPRRHSAKPRGLDTTLDVREMVPWTDCLAYTPICKMLTDAKAGAVVRQLEADLDDNLVVNYFTLSRPYSTKFKSIHDAMRNEHLAGVSGLPGGVHVLLIPNSELSSLLSLPRYNSKRPVFHVLFFSYKPFGGSTMPSLEQGLLNSQPNPRDILNGASADAFSLFAECFERLARTQAPPPVMPGFSPGVQITRPNMMVPPPLMIPPPMGTFGLSQPPPPPPEPPKAKEKAAGKSPREGGTMTEKTRHPHPDGGRSTSKDVSRDLFQKAMQNVGSAGKVIIVR
ncbi:hypothetical protein AAVH_02121 [Aphelenchoides avenae]|nr:hypothetical protein AAVH_02121 [Aphelenchus avenae]